MKIIKIFILLYVSLGIISCNIYTNRPIPFNKTIWNSWDIMFDESRYNMAIWFFNKNWFNGKTKEIILEELKNNKKINHIIYFYYKDNEIQENENILLFDLRYSNEFMERSNIDFDIKPIAYLKIYFNENNNIIKAEFYEGKRKNDVKEYKIKKYWEIK
jgi:hypothetical protein